MERWADIKGYEGLYQVSDLGRVCRLSHGKRKIRRFGSSHGYYVVSLCKEGKTHGYSVHRLVATAFVPNPDNLPQINHKDECKTNNVALNLEWCDATYNNNYGGHPERVSVTKSIDVLQCDLDGNVVKKWRGVSRASRELGICRTSISFCLTGRYRTAGGFIWKYAS